MDELKINVRINLTCRREQGTIAHKGACDVHFARRDQKSGKQLMKKSKQEEKKQILNSKQLFIIHIIICVN